MWRELLDDLYSAGAGADHAHASAGNVFSVGRPVGSVVTAAGEVAQSGEVGNVGLRAEPGAQHQVAAVVGGVGAGRHHPPVARLVEPCRRDTGVEIDVAREVEDVDDVIEVGHQLVAAGEPLGPGPVAPDLLERVLVVGHVGVDSGSRVAVVLPDAADPVARLDQPHGVPLGAQAVQQVQPAEPGPDDQRVEPARRCGSHDPVNLGSRFSMKARGPSTASDDAITRPAIRDSTANASPSGIPFDVIMTSLAARMASGPFRAMR